MGSEAPVLGIDRGNIGEVERKLEPFEVKNNAGDYLSPFFERIASEQPKMPEFCQEMEDELHIIHPNVYAFGAAVVYDVIPPEKKQQKVNEKVIGAAKQSIREAIRHIEDIRYLDVAWLYEKLRGDSPEVHEWLRRETNMMQEDTRTDFTAGAVVILLPIYMMNESVYLQARFFPPEK